MSDTSDGGASVLYLYCLIEARARVDDPTRTAESPATDGQPDAAYPGLETILAGLSGVGRTSVFTLLQEDLVAVLSALPAEAWTPAAIEDRLADPAWVEREVTAHETVVEACLAAYDLLPCKFMTLFSSADALRTMLAREAVSIRQSLRRVAGCREWSVHLLADLPRLTDRCSLREEFSDLRQRLAQVTGGQAFFLRKKLDRDLNDLVARLLQETASETEARLKDYARDGFFVAEPYQMEPDKKTLLNVAVLAPENRLEELRVLLAELNGAALSGLSYSLTGPWPPYHFAGAGQTHE